MPSEEVCRLCVTTLFAEVCLDFIRVVVQFGGVLEVVKEEQFGTSFCLKEFYMAVNAFPWLGNMLAVIFLLQVDIVSLFLAFLACLIAEPNVILTVFIYTSICCEYMQHFKYMQPFCQFLFDDAKIPPRTTRKNCPHHSGQVGLEE